MRTLYLAEFMFCKITEVQIVSETTEFVTIAKSGRREKRSSTHAGYYETREEAKQAILSRLLAKKQMLLWQIKSVEIEFAKASAL